MASSEEDEVKSEVEFDMFGDDYVYEPPRFGFLTTPVFDIFKINIHSKHSKCVSDGGELCTICGMVQVYDEELDVSYVVYERKEPEIIGSDGVLAVKGFPVICCAKFLTISVKLSCKAHGAEIANDSFVLDYCGAFEFDKILVGHAYGKHGYASVNHITFHHANVAVLHHLCISKKDDDFHDVPLYGTILAHLVTPDGEDHNKYPPTQLFNNLQQFNHQAVYFNSDINLFRSCLVIPASCSLKLQTNFVDNTHSNLPLIQHINLAVDFNGLHTQTVSGTDCEIQLQISWPNCYESFPRERKLDPILGAKQIFTRDLKSIIFPSVEEEPRCGPKCAMPFTPSSFIEIFSVLLCLETDVGVIRGSIQLEDSFGGNICRIFEGSQDCSRRKTLTIGCHPCIFEFEDDNGVKIDCDLKDSQERSVGKGVVTWRYVSSGAYFDRHLCSVFKGDIGYVAVHYSMFKSSMQARIKVSFAATTKVEFVDTCFEVCGEINARYGSYEYRTRYDLDFYSVTLFSETNDNCFQANLNFDLPLSKSLIALPLQDTLILNVSLNVRNARDMAFEAVEQKIEFKPYACNLFVIEKCKYDVSICVEWSHDKKPKPFSNATIPYERSLLKAKSKIRRS